METVLAALLSGLLFGAGLTISQMVNPAKVAGFLDVAGDWDPSLALVMGGALTVTAICYRLTMRRGAPLLASDFRLPTAEDVDARLIGGAALFGVGWGLAGFCPGPAIASTRRRVHAGSHQPSRHVAGPLVPGASVLAPALDESAASVVPGSSLPPVGPAVSTTVVLDPSLSPPSAVEPPETPPSSKLHAVAAASAPPRSHVPTTAG